VDQKYKRVENLDEKIKDVSLPYLEWKVLFLTAEDTSEEELGELIKEKSDDIAEALKSLATKGLIELAGSAPEEETAEEETISQEQVELEEETPEISSEEEMADTETDEAAAEEKPDEELVEEKPAEEFQEDKPDEEQTEEKAMEEEKTIEEETFDIVNDIKEEPEKEDVTDSAADEMEKELESESGEAEEKRDMADLLGDIDESIQAAEEVEQELESVARDGEVAEEKSAEDIIEEETTEKMAGEESTEALVEEEVTEEVVSEKPSEEIEKTGEEEAETEELSANEEIISDVSKQSIMVIDDSIVIRKMIEIALEEEDYRILTATSGKEGMEVIEKESPNLIILDMTLPDMNGIEILKKIKTIHKAPVIMLSGKDSPQLVESAKEVGVEDFLPKPFRDEELVEKVKNLLG
jgi:CheY-like chemotaxis protein